MEDFYFNPERSSSIELVYWTKDGATIREYKQDFETVHEAVEESKKLHNDKVLFELWVDGGENWDYKVTNKTSPEGVFTSQIGTFYIVKKSERESGCKSGFFGYLGHFIQVQMKRNKERYFGAVKNN
jgi:hypothetical protein